MRYLSLGYNIIKYLFIAMPCIYFSCNHNDKFNCEQIKKDYFKIIDPALSKVVKASNIIKLEDFLLSQPNCIEAYIALGDIYIKIDSIAKSYECYLSALKIDSQNIYSNYMCGTINESLKFYEKAILYYQTAMNVKTKDGFVLDINSGFKDISGRPTFDIPYTKLVLRKGISLYENGDLENSLYSLNYCIKNNQYLKEAYYYRSLIYYRIQDSVKGDLDRKMSSNISSSVSD